MNAANTTAASLPLLIAMSGAFLISAGDVPPKSAAELDIPRTPAAVKKLYGNDKKLSICSFNIQFLGNSRVRDDPALGAILRGFDIVVVQELVSPPYPGKFPNGTKFAPDEQSAEFFDVMNALGFEFILSSEDTGSGEKNHKNGSATEWWVAFYQPDRVQFADDLPGGFLAEDRSNNPDYERVPFAFPFRTADHSMDFVLISVHLMPGPSRKSTARRQHELASIGKWINEHNDVEKDFIIIGDMNIEDLEELTDATPAGLVSMNDQVLDTNTNVNSPKPYDHAMLNIMTTSEIDTKFDFKIVEIVKVMEKLWTLPKKYPGDPYHHNTFRQFYSDHDPVVIHMTFPEDDDD